LIEIDPPPEAAGNFNVLMVLDTYLLFF
jgi:hypothetical protein